MAFKRLDLNEKIVDELVDQAHNGKEAIERVQRLISDNSYYSLILTDCSMPIMDGYEASMRIRKIYDRMNLAQPFIVACTGHTEELYIRKAWQNNIDEVIAKPVKIEIV